MLIQNLIQNQAAFLGILIGFSWLIYTSLLISDELDLIKIVVNWFSTKKVVLPTLAALVLPFLFTYLYQEIPILIDRWKLHEFVGILGAIVGAILGFLISQFNQWKTETQEIKSVRKMLSMEINQYLVLLTEFTNKANDINCDYPNDFIIKNSFPQYNDMVWKSQVLLLPIALSDEEINQMYVLHKEIDEISKKYNLLKELVLENNEIGIIKIGGGIDTIRAMEKQSRRDDLRKEVRTKWKELTKIMTELINKNVVKNLLK